MKSLIILLILVVVVVLGVRLGFSCSSVQELELEVSGLEADLKTAEDERDDMARDLVDLQAEKKLLEERLTCCIMPELTVEKWVRTGSSGQWKDTVQARPGDLVQFRIVIQGVARNVRLKDILPSAITATYVSVDGKPITGEDIYDLYLGTVYGQCEVLINGRIDTKAGETTLVNVVTIWADCIEEQVSQATIEVKPRPSPTPSCCRPKPPPPPDTCPPGEPGPKPPVPDS